MNVSKPKLSQSVWPRVAFHVAAILCTEQIKEHSSFPFQEGDIVRTYIGLICIFARGITFTPAWLVPASLGLVQAGVLALLGFPITIAIFWGGAQSWLQRLFIRGPKNIRYEWVAFIVLLAGVSDLGKSPHTKISAAILISFFSITVLGKLLYSKIHTRYKRADAYPEIDQILYEASSQVPEAEKSTVKDDTIQMFHDSAVSLLNKQRFLSTDIQSVLQSISDSTTNILKCMTEDPRDFEPGRKFLERYLLATHTIVDTHIKLSQEGITTPHIVNALAKSREMLIRLQAAFEKEHAQLLENDVSDFSAELDVLDTMLKMRGS